MDQQPVLITRQTIVGCCFGCAAVRVCQAVVVNEFCLACGVPLQFPPVIVQPNTRLYHGGVVTRLGAGIYHASFDGIALGSYVTMACAEWVIDDYVWYLLDTGALDPVGFDLDELMESLDRQSVACVHCLLPQDT